MLALLGAVAVAAVLVWVWSLRSPPQIGADRAVFAAVDALFTAITAKDEKRLGECERRLRDHRSAGRLPADAADELDRIIGSARSGAWQSAAERLYRFMNGQRRERPQQTQ